MYIESCGVEVVDLWITGGNRAMFNAIQNKFPASQRQRCIKHKNEFFPSLRLNLGCSREVLGNQDEAQRYYDLAAQLGVVHQVHLPDEPPKKRIAVKGGYN